MIRELLDHYSYKVAYKKVFPSLDSADLIFSPSLLSAVSSSFDYTMGLKHSYVTAHTVGALPMPSNWIQPGIVTVILIFYTVGPGFAWLGALAYGFLGKQIPLFCLSTPISFLPFPYWSPSMLPPPSHCAHQLGVFYCTVEATNGTNRLLITIRAYGWDI